MSQVHRARLAAAGVLAAAASTAPLLAAGSPDSECPNILLILSDDAGYVDFGFQGSKEFPTPNLDRLAQSGVVFTQGYVSASVSSPSRAGLMTGRYQQRFGHEFNHPGTSPVDSVGMALSEQTMADALSARGYSTCAIGKWHLGQAPRYHPLRRGFDEFYGYLGGSRSYFPYKKRPGKGNRAMRNWDFEPDPPNSYVTGTLTGEAVSFIERHAEEPFFLYLSFTAVHGPMHALDGDLQAFEHIEKKGRRTLAGMTAALDRGVGRVLQALEETDQLDNTFIIFLNDNGGATNNHSDNGPLRGMKGSKWEGGIRVPFLMSWSGVLPEGARYEQPIISLDVFPTALAAAGAPVDALRTLDGVNLLPFLQGEASDPPHDTLFWRRGVAAAVRQGDWKLIRVSGSPPLLFNLADDPGETTNLARRRSRIAARLLERLEAWEADLAEPDWYQAKTWENYQIRKHQMNIVGRDAERALP
ncbi:MAG: sulfatase-like hydrolase/transferase [Phycisphaerales bacterium JB038]